MLNFEHTRLCERFLYTEFLHTRLHGKPPYSVRIWENTNHQRVYIRILQAGPHINLKKQPPRRSIKKLFNKVASGLQPWNFIKTRLQHRCFPVNIEKCLKHIFEENLRMAASEPSVFFFTLWTWNDQLICSSCNH